MRYLRAMKRLAWCGRVALVLALVGCGDDEVEPVDTQGVEGTSAQIDIDGDWSTEETFYDFPYPSDLRLKEDGTADYTGMPVTQTGDIFGTVWEALAARPAFPMQAVAYFRFDDAMPALGEYDAFAADASSPLLLIDIDPDSPDRGKLYPTSARTHEPDDFNPDNLLAVGAYPGVILDGDRTYAFVVMRSLNDAAGEPLGVSEAFATLAAGETPAGSRGEAAAELYAPLWETLDELDIDSSEVAAATVFTTGDGVRQNLEQSEGILAAHDVTVENVALDPDDGADHTRFCEVHGTIEMPVFQKGEAPYNLKGEAEMELDDDGVPIQQRTETVPVAFTIPKSEMPSGGYPLMLYIHGSGGVSTQAVDRGRITTPGGPATKGEGPAYVIAEHGIATVGAAMPLNPERNPGVGSFDYANTVNFSALPFNFRQGAYEQRLLLEALETFTIDPSVLTGCDGPTLPGGETAFYFNTDDIVLMGQSMGATYANLVAAIEPKIGAMAPSGAGAWNGVFLMESPFYGGLRTVVGAILAVSPENLSHLHPGVYLTQTAWEVGDPLASLPRINRKPFEGHPARYYYTMVADGDEFYPPKVFNEMALGMHDQQAGEPTWTSLQEDMKLIGTDGFADYPVLDNRKNTAGDVYSSVVVQYEGDGIANPHTIFSQLDEVKYQYGCFLSTYLETGKATLPEPADLGTPCPQ
jgi:hypothetical protein